MHPGGPEFQKAMTRMEEHIQEKLPHLRVIRPGLSIAVGGVKGPIIDADIPKCKEFGKKVAAQL